MALVLDRSQFALDISYNGAAYAGWQVQQNAVAVQQVLNKALATIYPDVEESLGSGRTDKGVHAVQQIVQFETERVPDPVKDIIKLNAMLPDDISVKSIHRLADGASVRFDAIKRAYEYRVTPEKDPFLQKMATLYFKPLDIDYLNDLSMVFLNHIDYKAFSKKKTHITKFECHISEAYWKREGNLIVFTISANRFLRTMVRTIVGTMFQMHEQKAPTKVLEDILVSKNRKFAGFAAPSDGLYLMKVEYPEGYFKTI